MSRQAGPQDRVTREYIEASRMGLLIRTPLENVTHFQFQDKYVTAFTKSNGEFVLKLSLHSVVDTLKCQATQVHRSYLVMNHMLRGIKRYRPARSDQWAFEILTTVAHGPHRALVQHTIPISRRETQRVNEVWRAACES